MRSRTFASGLQQGKRPAGTFFAPAFLTPGCQLPTALELASSAGLPWAGAAGPPRPPSPRTERDRGSEADKVWALDAPPAPMDRHETGLTGPKGGGDEEPVACVDREVDDEE